MNIKKIGLSALAGSLAMVSANAVELAVSGKSEVTYLSHDSNTTTGNPFGFGTAITFTGTGDMNGMTGKYFAVINDGGGAGFLSSDISLDMGAMGIVGLDQGTGSYGVATIDDMMPYAYEEIWTYTGAANGLRADGGATNVLGYKNTFAGYTLSLEIDPGHTNNSSSGATGDGGSTGTNNEDSGYNFALTGSPYEGVSAGLGYGKEESDLDNKADDSDSTYATAYVTYAMGGATVGYQQSEGYGGSVGTSSNDVTIYGISFQVNENFAVSYNKMKNTFALGGVGGGGTLEHTDEKTSGIAASYTLGSAAVRVLASDIKNKGGVKASDDDHLEVSLMLAF